MKSHKLLHQLKNKLTWLPILILAACQNNTVYHSYEPCPLTDGVKVIRLSIPCPIRSLPEITKWKSAYAIKNLTLTEIFG